MFRALFLSTLTCAAIGAAGQTDSLIRVLNDLPDDSNKVAAMGQAARELILRDTDRSILIGGTGLALAQHLGLRYHQATAHNLLGVGHNLQGDRNAALEHFLGALEISESLGKKALTANVRSNLARLYLDDRRLDLAEAEYRRAMREFRDLDEPIWEAGMVQGLADVYRQMDRRDSAQILFGKAADMLVQLQRPLHAALARHDQAVHTDGPGEDSLSLARHRQAWALLQEAENGQSAFTRMTILRGLGGALLRNGLDDEAEGILREALALATSAGQRQGRHDLHLLLAGVLERRGGADSALHHLRQYVALHDSMVTAERARAIIELQERYESERKDIALAHQRMLLERRTRSMYLLTGGIILMAISLLLLWRAWRAKQRTAAALRKALDERQLLLREIHHRVKNNLQMVGGLLRMQGRHIRDPMAREAVRDSQDRVRSMALIHQDLYLEDDPRGIQMVPYVEKLVHGLLKSHAVGTERIQLELTVDPVRLDVDVAMPIGLILNELIVNALKHAFPQGRTGRLRVMLKHQAEELVLEVSDNGVGHAAGTGMESGTPGFGLGMLRTFADKLGARYEMNGHPGTTVRMFIRDHKAPIEPALSVSQR